uniref:Polysaccharide biosynthesis/export protein n=1 Tax=mine drainage metagenome TaxID=410659 RepID=E6PZW7_9ZZZZ
MVCGGWLALGGALLLDALRLESGRKVVAALALVCALGVCAGAQAQAPLPSTSGVPTGVVPPFEQEVSPVIPPNPKTAPPVWNTSAPTDFPNTPANTTPMTALGLPMALPIHAGDFLDVSEFHTPEFHATVRVSAGGTVNLSMIGAIKVAGMSESEAEQAVQKALVEDGMLLHPEVKVLVTNAAGQDVSVLGEVARPGVYPYATHHRLLDLISAASGMTPTAGRLVSIFHREDPHTAHPVVMDPSGTDSKVEHNPELEPGDTVLVSRAGLVYVIGDVVRPGGFAVDPTQGLTVVQALSLAWGATPNAVATKAILIRNQKGGRTMTTLNLKRMIRGQDPDLPVRDQDILYVPDSATKNLLNKSLEAAIQSVIGVSLYAGLVYSQRF